MSEWASRVIENGGFQLIDIHCHILRGLDDGARDLNMSVEMARIAYEDGIRHIIATPHYCDKFKPSPADQLERIEELRTALTREGIGITVSPGNEVRLESAAFVYRHEEAGDFFYLDEGRRFLLIEQRWEGYNQESEDVFAWLISRGTTPIIPHPERHAFFREQPELLYRLLDLGAWTQVTADSLIGKNGPEAAAFGRWLVEKDQVHVLATDAHNTKRKPNLSAGLRAVSEMAGAGRTQEILDRMNAIYRFVTAEDAASF